MEGVAAEMKKAKGRSGEKKRIVSSPNPFTALSLSLSLSLRVCTQAVAKPRREKKTERKKPKEEREEPVTEERRRRSRFFEATQKNSAPGRNRRAPRVSGGEGKRDREKGRLEGNLRRRG